MIENRFPPSAFLPAMADIVDGLGGFITVDAEHGIRVELHDEVRTDEKGQRYLWVPPRVSAHEGFFHEYMMAGINTSIMPLEEWDVFDDAEERAAA